MPYQLEIILSDNENQNINVTEQMRLGSSPELEICLEDYGLPSKACVFRLNQDILTIINLGMIKPALKIGKQNLDKGKMYILDDQDQITLGDISILVHEQTYEEDDIDHDEKAENLGFESTDNLAAQEPDDDLEEAEDPTSINVSRLLKLSKDDPAQQTNVFKDNTQTTDDEDEDDDKKNESTSSRLLRLTSKVKDFVTKRKDERKSQPPVKASTPKPMVNKGSKKIKVGPRSDWPGFIPRLIALGLDFTICAVATSSLSQNKDFQIQWEDLLAKLQTAAQNNNELFQLNELLLTLGANSSVTLLFFVFLNLFMSFIIGRTLGQALMGINEESGFITKRIKGSLRFILGVTTLPFLIFDLPIFFKKRSFKEWVTRSSLYRPSGLPGLVSTILVLPALILYLFYADILTQKPIYSFSVKELSTQENRNSKYFRPLNLQLSHPDILSFKTLPVLTKLSAPAPFKETQKIQRGMALFFEEHESPIKIFQGPSYNPDKWLQKFVETNLLLEYIKPEVKQLSELLRSAGPLSLDQRNLLREIFQISLTDDLLKPKSLLNVIQNYGPDLNAFNRFSKALNEDLKLDDKKDLEWIRQNSEDILWREFIQGDQVFIQLTSLQTTPFRSFFINFPKKSRMWAIAFLKENFLGTKSLDFIPTTKLKDNELGPQENLLSNALLQFYRDAESNDPKMTPQELEKLYEVFFQISGELMGSDPESAFTQTFDKQMESFIKQTNQIENELSSEYLKTYQKLKRVFKAYQNQRSSFFIQDKLEEVDNAQDKSEEEAS